jgi:putative transposase
VGTSGYATDLTNEQWRLVEDLLLADAAHRRGPKVRDARRTFEALLYQAHTGCQWRYLPTVFGRWELVWGRFSRWSGNGTFGAVLLGLHGQARLKLGRAEALPSLLIIDSQLARGASNGGATFHERGGPHGATNGAKRVVAVDVTGLPVVGLVVSARTSEVAGEELLVAKLAELGGVARLDKVLVDKGTAAGSAVKLSRIFGVEFERYGWGTRPSRFEPIARAWRVEVAHGAIGRSRRLAKSFENTAEHATSWLELACISMVLDTWSGRQPRPSTAYEATAKEARRSAPRVQPQPKDLGIYTPTPDSDGTGRPGHAVA